MKRFVIQSKVNGLRVKRNPQLKDASLFDFYLVGEFAVLTEEQLEDLSMNDYENICEVKKYRTKKGK